MATKVGATKGSGSSRRKWNGKRWVSSPVRTTRTPAARTRQENRRSSSSSSSRTIPASKRPADMRKGVTYGDAGKTKSPKTYTVSGVTYNTASGKAQAAKDGKTSSNGYSIKDGRRTNGHKAPKVVKPEAVKTPPKKTPPKKTPPKKTPPKAAKPATPAKRKPRSWLKDNYKPGVKGIKSSRLSSALSNLKVRDYKKKK